MRLLWEGVSTWKAIRIADGRGADVSKIVTDANDMEQQIENLRITNLLKKELGIPFLLLVKNVIDIFKYSRYNNI